MTYHVPVKAGRRTRPATGIETAILEVLKAKGELSTSQVAESVGRHVSRASTVLHRLFAAGMVSNRKAADLNREGVTWVMWRIRSQA